MPQTQKQKIQAAIRRVRDIAEEMGRELVEGDMAFEDFAEAARAGMRDYQMSRGAVAADRMEE